MLTSYQAETVAFVGDGYLICATCAHNRLDQDGSEAVSDLAPLCRYSVDEEFPGGLTCESCYAEIVEPADDFCTFHESWRAYQRGSSRRWCEEVTSTDDVGGVLIDLEEARICSFPS